MLPLALSYPAQKINFSLLLAVCLILINAPTIAAAAVPEEPAWRLDAAIGSDEPIHFRRDADLKIAGGGQPTKEVLAHLSALLGVPPDMPIWDIDLRQESHGFLNHAAVSWHGPQNAANRGLAATEVEQDETARLQGTLGHVVQALPMGRYDEEHIKDSFDESVQSWSTERKLARRAGLGYKRFAATDMEWPAPAVIDDFVEFYRSLPKITAGSSSTARPDRGARRPSWYSMNCSKIHLPQSTKPSPISAALAAPTFQAGRVIMACSFSPIMSKKTVRQIFSKHGASGWLPDKFLLTNFLISSFQILLEE